MPSPYISQTGDPRLVTSTERQEQLPEIREAMTFRQGDTWDAAAKNEYDAAMDQNRRWMGMYKGMDPARRAAFRKVQDRLGHVQQSIIDREDADVVGGLYGNEYRKALGATVGRGGELEQARASDMMTAMQQMQGAQMARGAVSRGPEIARAQLQQGQNQLAEQLAGIRGAGGAMGARQAIMGSGGAGGQLAVQGLGQMSQEDLSRRGAAMGAMSGARQGMLGSAGLGTAAERAEDAYKHARSSGAMGWLGMGQQRREAEDAALLKLMGATTGQEQQAQTAPAWKSYLAGGTNLLATAIPMMANRGGGGGGIIDPNQLKTPWWAK